MATIVHAADFHIGARFEFLPPQLAQKAVRAQMEALQRMVRHAGEIQADAVLIAGDLFDTPQPSPATAAAVFGLLQQCPAPVFLAPGNHDYYSARSPYAQPLPSNVTVFTGRQLSAVPLEDGRTVVWGAAFQDTKADIALTAPLDPTKVNLCVVHGELGGDHGYNAIDEQAVAGSGFAYLALGHNHRYSGVFRLGDTALSCPGCFAATSRAETGVKGYLAGTVGAQTTELDFYPSGAVRFEEIAVQMGGIAADSMLLDTVRAQLPRQTDRVCCTVRLTGTSSYQPDTEQLIRLLGPQMLQLTVCDESAPEGDLFRYQEDDGLLGMVTRELGRQLEQAETEEEYAKQTLALEYALAALEGREME